MSSNFDPKQVGKVAVLMGGLSAEREVSLENGQKVFDALQRKGVDVMSIDVNENIINTLQQTAIDLAFPVLHGPGGEDGQIQAVLETLKIPFVGSNMTGCAISMDKQRCKLLWKGAGLATPDFMMVNRDTDPKGVISKLGLPLCIKPVFEGSSFGVSKVSTPEQYQPALETALHYEDDILVEQWIEGPEFTVGILGDQALPSIQIKTARQFYDYAAKYQVHTTDYLIPSGLDEKQEAEIRALSLAAHSAAGCRHWSRLDLMQDHDGKFWLLELNPIPGLVLYPRAAKAAGIEFDDFVMELVKLAVV